MFGPFNLCFTNLYFANPPQFFNFPVIHHPQTLTSFWTPPLENSEIKIEQDVSSGQGLSAIKNEEPLLSNKRMERVSRYKYAKKNVESNIVNQVISFCKTKSKSKKVLMRLLQSEEKVETFYQIMRQAKKKKSGYVGRAFLQNLLQLDEDHPIYILYKKLKEFKVNLKFSDIKRGLRHLANYFLRNMIVPTVLTSSKLDKTTIQQHLVRARELYSFVNNIPLYSK